MGRLPSEEEELIRKTAREFAHSLGLDAAADRDRHSRFPTEALQQAAGLGFLGLAAGGPELPPTSLALVLDELAQVDATVAACLAAHNACLRLAREAPASVRDALVASLSTGELAALLASEEAHGSDVATVGTRATPAKDGWTLTGQKVWSVNAEAAQRLFVLAHVGGKEHASGPGATTGTPGQGAPTGPTGPTLFAIPADRAGVTFGQGESIMGLRAAGIRTAYLYNVAASKDEVVGEIGGAMPLMASAQAWLRVGVAACLDGCVAGAFAAAAQFAQTRVQFQAPIGTYQAVSDTLTSADAALHASRSLTLDAAARLGTSEEGLWAARAKAFATEMAITATRQAIRVQGGTGFMREGGTERFARDVRALQFMGGAVQMQKDTQKRALLPELEFGPSP